MRIYIDSSALVKRALDEAESVALVDEIERLLRSGDTLVCSRLAAIEVSRTLRRTLEARPPRHVADLIDTCLSGISRHEITESVESIARRLDPRSLRSLDAIHLATAAVIDADLVITYDERMILAAEELGFIVSTPRRDPIT